MKLKFVILYIFFTISVFAQEQTFSVHYKNFSTVELLQKIENDYLIYFSYLDELLKQKTISYSDNNCTLSTILKEIENQNNVKIIKIDEHFFIIVSDKMSEWQQQSLKEIIIKSFSASGISKRKNGSFRLDLNSLGLLPGSINTDVLESIQQLPGVISTDETVSNFSIRGGLTDQNKIMIDGINMYQNGHLFGMISPFNPYAIYRINYYYKGTPSVFEGGASGIIDISTSNKIINKTKVNAGVNGLSTDLVLSLPILKNKLSLVTSVRTSYRSVLLTPTLQNFEEQVFQNTNVNTTNSKIHNFSFNDFITRINYKYNKFHHFSATVLNINQNLDFTNTLSKDFDKYYENNLFSNTKGLSLRAQNMLNNQYQLTTQFAISWYDLKFNNITNTNHKTTGIIDKENFVSDTKFNTELLLGTHRINKLRIGYQYNEKRSAYLFKVIVNDKIYIFDYLRSVLNTHALYTSYTYRNKSLFDFDAGLRLQYTQELEKLFIEPRFTISRSIFPYVKLQATAEIKHQNIQQYNKTVIGLLNLENNVWNVANQGLFPVIEEQQFTTGLIYAQKKWFSEFDLYYKKLKNITITVPYRIYNKHEYFVGNEYVKGFDYYIERKFKYFDMLVKYSYTDVKNKFDSLKNSELFLSELGIKHRVFSSVKYKRKNFQIALGWQWLSKRPYYKNINFETEGTNTVNNQFEIDYLNSIHKFNFSSTFTHKFSDKYALKLSFSAKNIFNSKYKLFIKQNSYFLDTALIDFEKYTINRTLNFSLRFYWH